MPEVIKNVLSSRKDLFALVIIIAVTVLFAMSRIDYEKWWTVVQWLGGAWLLVRGAEDVMVKSSAVKAGGRPKASADD